jgi:DNA uptake protein ComE-like DNA-binding protein
VPALTPKNPDFEWAPVADEHPDEAPNEAPAAAPPRPSEPRLSSSAPRRARPSLDLNGARFDQLCSLGLEPHQAAGLIGRREQRGGFESVHDLDELDGKYGLARAKIEALKNAVAV